MGWVTMKVLKEGMIQTCFYMASAAGSYDVPTPSAGLTCARL